MKKYLAVAWILAGILAACTSSQAQLPPEPTLLPRQPLADPHIAETNQAWAEGMLTQSALKKTRIVSPETPTPKPLIVLPGTTPALSPTLPIANTSKVLPWLIYNCLKQADPAIATYTLADGSHCKKFNLPDITGMGRGWEAIPAPRGGWIAFRARLGQAENSTPGADAFKMEPNGIDGNLWILKLPENGVTQQIPLVSQAAWAELDASWQEIQAGRGNGTDVPVIAAVIQNSDAYRWSPDGRYLAFSAASQSKELYLEIYDTQTRQVQWVPGGQPGEHVLGWSPDSRWMLVGRAEKCILADGCRLQDSGAYWGVSPIGVRNRIPAAGASPAIQFQWIGGHTVLLQDDNGQGLPRSTVLRTADLEGGEVRVLYKGGFTSAAYLPFNNSYLLLVPPGEKDISAGLYRLDPASRSLKPYSFAGYTGYSVAWQPQLNLVQLSRPDPDDPAVLLSIFLTTNGKKTFQVKSACCGGISLSPDGRWFLALVGEDSQVLFDSRGNQVAAFRRRDYALNGDLQLKWVSDGSTLYGVGTGCMPGLTCFFRFTPDTGWAPDWFGQAKGENGSLLLVEP